MIGSDAFLRLIDEVDLVQCEGGQFGWVYFVVCVDLGRCKIGFTSGKVEKRIKSLQTGSPSQLVLLVAHPGSTESERALHERFASSRVVGEWFDITPELRAYMVAALWAVSEFTLKQGQRLTPWMAAGLSHWLSTCSVLPESLVELLEADPA